MAYIHKLSSEQQILRQKISRIYLKQDHTAKYTAKALKIKEAEFYHILRAIGLRPKGRSDSMRSYRLNGKPDLTKSQFLELLQKYERLSKIEEATGYSKCYLCNCFKRFNVKYQFSKINRDGKKPIEKEGKKQEVKKEERKGREVIKKEKKGRNSKTGTLAPIYKINDLPIFPTFDPSEALELAILYDKPQTWGSADQEKRKTIDDLAFNLDSSPSKVYECLEKIRYECNDRGLDYFVPKLKASLAEIYKKIEGEEMEGEIKDKLDISDLVFMCCLLKTLDASKISLSQIHQTPLSIIWGRFLSFVDKSIAEYTRPVSEPTAAKQPS